MSMHCRKMSTPSLWRGHTVEPECSSNCPDSEKKQKIRRREQRKELIADNKIKLLHH